MQIVVEHAVHRRLTLGCGVADAGEFAGVGAEQVVEAEPTGCLLGQQVRPCQFGEPRAGLLLRHAGQAGRGVDADVGTGVQPQQPEQPRGVRAELIVGPREHGARVRARIAAEGFQAVAGVEELAGQHRQRELRVGDRAGGYDDQGQRQPRARGDDLLSRFRFGGHPVRAEPAGQQLPGFAGGEQVQCHRAGRLGGDQAGELAAAGDDDHAAGRAAQQRPDLGGVPGVVQHHQHPPAGQQAAVQSRLGIQADRDPPGRHLEGIQETPHRLGRARRRLGRIEPAQVHVQLPVGNRAVTWCAQVSASAVLPIPAVPPIAEMTTAPPVSAA